MLKVSSLLVPLTCLAKTITQTLTQFKQEDLFLLNSEVAIGDSLVLLGEANPSTGYRWIVEPEDSQYWVYEFVDLTEREA